MARCIRQIIYKLDHRKSITKPALIHVPTLTMTCAPTPDLLHRLSKNLDAPTYMKKHTFDYRKPLVLIQTVI